MSIYGKPAIPELGTVRRRRTVTAWTIIEQARVSPSAGSERGGMEGEIWRKETNTNEREVPE